MGIQENLHCHHPGRGMHTLNQGPGQTQPDGDQDLPTTSVKARCGWMKRSQGASSGCYRSTTHDSTAVNTKKIPQHAPM